jgi:hypothetical protein
VIIGLSPARNYLTLKSNFLPKTLSDPNFLIEEVSKVFKALNCGQTKLNSVLSPLNSYCEVFMFKYTKSYFCFITLLLSIVLQSNFSFGGASLNSSFEPKKPVNNKILSVNKLELVQQLVRLSHLIKKTSNPYAYLTRYKYVPFGFTLPDEPGWIHYEESHGYYKFRNSLISSSTSPEDPFVLFLENYLSEVNLSNDPISYLEEVFEMFHENPLLIAHCDILVDLVLKLFDKNPQVLGFVRNQISDKKKNWTKQLDPDKSHLTPILSQEVRIQYLLAYLIQKNSTLEGSHVHKIISRGGVPESNGIINLEKLLTELENLRYLTGGNFSLDLINIFNSHLGFKKDAHFWSPFLIRLVKMYYFRALEGDETIVTAFMGFENQALLSLLTDTKKLKIIMEIFSAIDLKGEKEADLLLSYFRNQNKTLAATLPNDIKMYLMSLLTKGRSLQVIEIRHEIFSRGNLSNVARDIIDWIDKKTKHSNCNSALAMSS